jgi:MraZ protein
MLSSKLRKFAGEYLHSLDSKNRVTVPRKWRFDGDDDDSAYLAIPQPVGYIWLCPPSIMEQLDEKLESILPTDLEGLRFKMYLMKRSVMVYCDKSSRIVLTPALIEHAGLTNQVQLVGMYGSWSIWNPDRYEKFEDNPFSLDIGAKGRQLLNVMEKIWKTETA